MPSPATPGWCYRHSQRCPCTDNTCPFCYSDPNTVRQDQLMSNANTPTPRRQALIEQPFTYDTLVQLGSPQAVLDVERATPCIFNHLGTYYICEHPDKQLKELNPTHVCELLFSWLHENQSEELP